MFDPQRLLGQLMGDAMSGSLGGKRKKNKKYYGSSGGSLLGGSLLGGMSGATKAKLGMGVLGIAIAAFDHYKNKASVSTSTPTAMPPPPPMPQATPMASQSPPPPPAASALRNEQAMHLLRAMITAANADGIIDNEERSNILDRAKEAGLQADDLQMLDVELRAPLTLDQLVVRTSAELREQVYAASVIAITNDTEQEQQYLDTLASKLNLDPAARQQLHAELGI